MPPLPISELQTLLSDSANMLAMAEAGDWDALIAMEHERRGKIGRLRELAIDEALLPAAEPDRGEAIHLIQEILRLDEQTRRLAERWMSQLSQDLGELQRARKVGQAYLGG